MKGGREKRSWGCSLIGRPAQMAHEDWRPLWHLPKFQITSLTLLISLLNGMTAWRWHTN